MERQAVQFIYSRLQIDTGLGVQNEEVRKEEE